jgi:hypothetical protein
MNAALAPYLTYVVARMERIEYGEQPDCDDMRTRFNAIKMAAFLTFPDPAQREIFIDDCIAEHLLDVPRLSFPGALLGAVKEVIHGR